MPIIVRQFDFDYGHRVWGHESKCAHLHGHHAKALVTVEAPKLDNLGRVLDFSSVKTIVGKWIDDNWDHNFLAHVNDPIVALSNLNAVYAHNFDDGTITYSRICTPVQLFGMDGFDHKKPFIMPNGMNPTAECMAEVLCKEVNRAFDLSGLVDLICTQVQMFETPNCSAIYEQKLHYQ